MKGRLLLWFGVFAGLYGLRELFRSTLLAIVLGASEQQFQYVESFISYVIIVPAALFFEEWYGKGWRGSVRWLVWVFAAWGVVGIATVIAVRRPFALPDPGGGLLILLPTVLLIGAMRGYRPRDLTDAPVIISGAVVFIVTVINEHLNRAILPGQLRYEPVGFIALIGCLGYVAMRRFVAGERQLLAMEEEMKAASRIQAAILPAATPQVRGLGIAVRYAPMAAVAGDFYGFLEVDETRAGILIADVMGHGVPAALVASMVKVGITAQAAHAGDPAQVVAGLNQMLCHQAPGQLCTACYLYVDSENRWARYAAAGHPAALCCRRGSVRELQCNGLLFGVRAAERYAGTEIDLQPGDRILLYTDGITEAANPSDEMFGKERLQQFVAEHSELAVEKFADALVDEVRRWSAGVQADDLTLAVVDMEL